jgi:hypothetical protein
MENQFHHLEAGLVRSLYQELQAMTVSMDHATERGPQYLLTQLQECRRKADRVSQILILLSQERSNLLRARRATMAGIKLAGEASQADALRAQLEGLLDSFDEVKGLLEAVRVVRANLRITDSDIRLGAKIMEQQRQMGGSPAPPGSQGVQAPEVDMEVLFGEQQTLPGLE